MKSSKESSLRLCLLGEKQECTEHCVRSLPWVVLTMNSHDISSTGPAPHELFHGGHPVLFFKTPFPEDYKIPVGDWLVHRQEVRKSHYHFFLGGLDPGQAPPKSLLLMLRLT